METKNSETPHNTSLIRGLTFDSITKTSVKTGAADKDEDLKSLETKVAAAGGPVVSRVVSGGANATSAGSNIQSSRATDVDSRKEEKTKQERGKQMSQDVVGRSPSLSPSSHLHPLPQPSTHPASSKTLRDSETMTDPSEMLHLRGRERREVGVQVEVDEQSASTSSSLHMGAPTSSLIGSPSCQSGSLTSLTVPSLCCVSAGQPPFQHICKIDIELRSQLVLPSVVTDKASSLPACTYSFQQSPALGQNHEISAESIWEDKEEEKGDSKGAMEQIKEEEEREKKVTLQEVAWDKQGMTWEVYGASMDLECLGTAIQSHLESKIREQQKHIRSLRKSNCSNRSLRGYRMKTRRKRRGGFLGCCRKAAAVAE